MCIYIFIHRYIYSFQNYLNIHLTNGIKSPLYKFYLYAYVFDKHPPPITFSLIDIFPHKCVIDFLEVSNIHLVHIATLQNT